MDFNADCKLCDREAVNSSGLCAKHLKESRASAPPAVSCIEWTVGSTDWLDALTAELLRLDSLTRLAVMESRFDICNDLLKVRLPLKEILERMRSQASNDTR